jgi:hypothetical protein
VLFYYFTQRRMTACRRRFGKPYQSHLPRVQISYALHLNGGTDRLCRNVGDKLSFYAACNPRRAKISFKLQGNPLKSRNTETFENKTLRPKLLQISGTKLFIFARRSKELSKLPQSGFEIALMR